MRRIAIAVIGVGLVAGALGAAGGAEKQTSRAVSNEMLDELDAEIKRGLNELAVPGEPKPYFIAYKLTEVDVNDVSASLGAATSVKTRHFMNLESHVRVGDHQFDNSNFILPRSENTDGSASIQLALEATPKTARKAAWLATDAAYKEALEQYTSKKALVARDPSLASKAPSYTREPPTVMMEPVEVPPLEDTAALRERAEKVSAAFRDQPHVRDSRVAYTTFLERRWYLNSEGTRAHDVRRVAGVIIVASAQAEDGEILTLYYSRYGNSLDDLPGVDALEKEALALSRDLDALRTAPVLHSYSGPVLFEGVAAAQIARHTLVHHLSGTPVPIGLTADAAAQYGGAFSDRIGRRAVSPLLTITDDPTTSRSGKRYLIGGFKFDDEGVPAQRVEIIKDGIVKTLLMSRTPSSDIQKSNGHARRPGPGLFHGSATNLFITGKKGLSDKALRKQLLAEAKAQGLDYALVIKRFDDVFVTANAEMSPLELVSLLQRADSAAPPPILLAYRVYPDGREELVRGMQLRPMPRAQGWKDVIATGKSLTVYNFLNNSGDDGSLLLLQGGGDGFVPSAGVESAIVTPDLLFKEVEVKRAVGHTPDPPPVPKP